MTTALSTGKITTGKSSPWHENCPMKKRLVLFAYAYDPTPSLPLSFLPIQDLFLFAIVILSKQFFDGFTDKLDNLFHSFAASYFEKFPFEQKFPLTPLPKNACVRSWDYEMREEGCFFLNLPLNFLFDFFLFCVDAHKDEKTKMFRKVRARFRSSNEISIGNSWSRKMHFVPTNLVINLGAV